MTNDACSFYTHVQKLEVFFTFLFLSYWQLFMSLQLKIKNLINSNVALLTLETRVHTKCSVSWCCLLISALNIGMYQVKQNFPSKSVIKLIKYLIYFSLVSYTFLLCIFMLMKQYLLIYIVYICWHWPEVDEKEIGTPEKYPEHTFEVSHSRRRSYLITAENDEDKHAWIEAFKVCCRKAEGKQGVRPVNTVTTGFDSLIHAPTNFHSWVVRSILWE